MQDGSKTYGGENLASLATTRALWTAQSKSSLPLYLYRTKMVCLLLNDTNYGDIKLYQHKHLKESPFFLRISTSEE